MIHALAAVGMADINAKTTARSCGFHMGGWRGPTGGNTALHQAAYNNSMSACRALIDAGADLEAIGWVSCRMAEHFMICQIPHAKVGDALLGFRSKGGLNTESSIARGIGMLPDFVLGAFAEIHVPPAHGIRKRPH